MEITIDFEDVKFLRNLKSNLNTQDNRSTADPIWLMQEKTQHIIPEGFSDESEFVENLSGDHCTYDTWYGAAKGLLESGYSKEDIRNDTSAIEEFYFVYEWHTVQTFFTEDAAKAYIARNGHNHNELRIYVGGLYRNAELMRLRNILMNLQI